MLDIGDGMIRKLLPQGVASPEITQRLEALEDEIRALRHELSANGLVSLDKHVRNTRVAQESFNTLLETHQKALEHERSVSQHALLQFMQGDSIQRDKSLSQPFFDYLQAMHPLEAFKENGRLDKEVELIAEDAKIRRKAQSVKKKPTKKKAPKDKAFVFADSVAARDIKELRKHIEKCSEGVLHHHMHNNRNDFAAWINDVLQSRPLARTVSFAKSREELLKIRK